MNRRSIMLVLAGCLFALALLAGCGSSSDSSSSPASTSSDASTAPLEGLKVDPPKPAPPLELTDYQGDTVNLEQFRGKAVLVTFLYTHCPDVCPLIVGNLQAAQKQLGDHAGDMQILAVSVDPKGDTPASVTDFLDAHNMTGKMDWLVGSRPELEHTWKAWGVATNIPKSSPELVEHSAEIFGVDASGTVRTLYPANFKPEMIVNDVPVLASE